MTCVTNEKPIARVELEVNGKKVELNNFVNNFIAATMIGMVKALRGVGEPEVISLKISKETQ